MAADVHVFGVRHHGPGCARALEAALEALRPAVVLIEGPSDASALAALAGDPAMKPPVALLVYNADSPERASFWPFAAFSPEWRALLWAARNGVEARFIDLPASAHLAEEREKPSEEEAAPKPVDPAAEAIQRDPIGALAAAAGHEDGESWWRDLIEENPAPGPVFAAIESAMTELRAKAPPPEGFEAMREAQMRLEIRAARKAAPGPVAVVCGAWHVPALREDRPEKDDKALLKNLPKAKTVATWAPWSLPRLAFGLGYGAGVASPGWLEHLWTSVEEADLRWLARAAALLREKGRAVSTASLIEAARLTQALTALRGRPATGFDELREAIVACLCEGEDAAWDSIADELLLGAGVGSIPENMPLAPLMADLQRQQKALKMPPEALDREASLDLRTDVGLAKSTLLHRLDILGVPWGRLEGAGRSRGTFRENWTLCWEPDFAVRLVENLVYGASVAEAAAGKLTASLPDAKDLRSLADLVMRALTAQLPGAASAGVAALERRAAESGDALSLLSALPPLADAIRYGGARKVETGRLQELFDAIAVRAAIAAPAAAQGIDAEASDAMRGAIQAADAALELLEAGGVQRENWRAMLHAITDHPASAPLLAGLAARMLYEAKDIAPEDAALRLGRALSPGVKAADAAGWFQGFFEGAAARLIQDAPLRASVDGWLVGLDEPDFIAALPLIRRALSGLDASERKRLLDAALGRACGAALPGLKLAPHAAEIWAERLPGLLAILKGVPA